MNSSNPDHHDRDRSVRSYSERRSSSPSSNRPNRAERASDSRSRERMDRSGRISNNRRQRDTSPSRRSISSDGNNNNERLRRQHREKRGSRAGDPRRRRRRKSTADDDNGDDVVVDWGRSTPTRSPRRLGNDPVEISKQQVKQISSPPLTDPQDENQYEESMDDPFDGKDPFDEMAASHRDANPSLRRAGTAPVKNASKTKRSSKINTLINDNSSVDIDAVIMHFKEQTTAHMAMLLDYKNTLTTPPPTANTESEKDKEFQQVRQWYGALAEKHTKLQKEHQALQEEHQKLKERYDTLQRASTLNESFVAHFGGDILEKEAKKKEKKDKNKLEVVWSRAGKITKSATKKVQQKVHHKLTNESQTSECT